MRGGDTRLRSLIRSKLKHNSAPNVWRSSCVHCTQLVHTKMVCDVVASSTESFCALVCSQNKYDYDEIITFSLCVRKASRWCRYGNNVHSHTRKKNEEQKQYRGENVYTGSVCARFTLFALASIHTYRIDKFIIIIEMIPHTHSHSNSQIFALRFFYYLFLQGNNNVRKLCCLFRVETMCTGFHFLSLSSASIYRFHPLNRSLVCFSPTSFLFDFDLMPQHQCRHDGGRDLWILH